MPESDSTSGSAAARRSAFWTTLPGILTGIAAVITASVGLITILSRTGRERSGTPADKPAATSSAPASAPVASPSTPSASVFAQGRITMRSPDNADLEKGLAGTGVTGEDLYLYCSGTDCLLNPMSSLMSTTEGPGDKASCAAALGSRREGALRLNDMRAGQVLCIQTSDGHVGSLKILGLPGVGSNEFVFSYTLYR